MIAISTAQAARAGILVKDRLALERMRSIDAVLFDKTGTLTTRRACRHRRRAVGRHRRRAAALAGAAESDSEHPLAKAIVAAARTRARSRPRASSGR